MSDQRPEVPGTRPGRTPGEDSALSFPHAEPTPYQQMLRTWAYAWWRPVVGVVVTLVGFVFVASIVLYLVALVGAAFSPGSFAGSVSATVDIAHDVSPLGLLGVNLGIASLILVVWFNVRVLHRLRLRWLLSVVPGMRWRFFSACLGIAVVALVAQIVVSALLPGGDGDDLVGGLRPFTTRIALSVLVVVLTTPLQAAAEELVFRGYLLMAFGSVFRHTWVAILGTAVLFALAHGAQNAPLFFDRFAFGLIAGWLVTRTGGLEAGIALHVVNNFFAFGLALAFGDLTSTLNVTSVSWWNIVLTVTQSGVYTLLVLLVARRMGLQKRTRPPGALPASTLGPAPRPV